MDLKEEAILGDDVGQHWYYRSKSLALRTLIAPFLSQGTVLDVGAGAGFFARELISTGFTRQVTCVDTGYSDDHDEALPGGQIRFRRSIASTDADLALFMDVLEHVDDDAELLDQYRVILGRDKYVAITVPAFQFLWSGHDDFLEHRRRYTLHSLESVLEESGLTAVQTNYFYGAVFPVAAAQRLADRLRAPRPPESSLRRHRPATNHLLTGICQAETRIQKRNRLAGLSVMAMALTR